ncbi:hypothetical protein A9Q84_09080 [Halobacteriovorax marinus]|uniref:Lipoprotein n=1 Tax=Halobacteriovorax marinus TaxID=97084 RepID=A0A1Y5FCZ7_9BACT|nr:hypothetical protein A9Q84_09080 [Halobacteriovorax marinus]
MKNNWAKFSFRGFSSRTLRNFIYLSLLSSLVSCSWISNKRSLFGDDEESSANEKRSATLQTVPKAQYDQLERKYNNLLKTAKSKKVVADSPMSNIPPEDIVNQLNNATPTNDLVETVDVFGQMNTTKKKSIDKRMAIVTSKLTPSEIEEQIIKLERAVAFISKNKFDQALTLLKELENSNVRQISVNAKFQIGELLFIQQEYDLAMQVFEEIIHKDAFSGLVLKVLGRLIVCSEKLKQTKKQQRYYSVLHDFFESA